jgi:hypothetical protein
MWWVPLSLANHKTQNKIQGVHDMIIINKQPEAVLPIQTSPLPAVTPPIIVAVLAGELEEYLDKVRVS